MFKTIKDFFKSSSLFLILLVLGGITASAQSYSTLQVIIEDPYTCGQNITGMVSSGTSPISVLVEVLDSSNNVRQSYTIDNLSSGSNYTVERPDRDITGNFTVRSTATDANGTTDVETFQANILAPSDCPVLTTIRTGASNFVKNNLLVSTIALGSIAYAGFLLTKNQKVAIAR